MTLYSDNNVLDQTERHLTDWQDCRRCPLHKTRTNVVLASGCIPSDFLFVGDAPGQYDDSRASPFMGPAGQLLRSIINSALEEWSEETRPTYALTNLVACVPRYDPTSIEEGGVRDPTSEEIQACRPRLLEFEEIAQPSGIVFVGDLASQCFKIEKPSVRVTHPSLILRFEDKNLFPQLVLREIAALVNFFSRNYIPF